MLTLVVWWDQIDNELDIKTFSFIMSLRDISYQKDYRSGQDNILYDFIRPSLSNSVRYDRAVGFFSSSALELFGSPLGQFIKQGGTIRLVTSVKLTNQDYSAIKNGAPRKDIAKNRLDKIIEEEFADGMGDGVKRLCTLLELDRIEIKIAIPKNSRGIFHEKVGIFYDNKDHVAFSGSANESLNAFEEHYECVDVFPSWSDPARAKRKLDHFKNLWSDDEKGVSVYDFPEALEKKLIRIAKEPGPAKPKTETNKWRHQDHAVALFLEKERGILNMATGTGKTRTAIKIILSLFNDGLIDTAVVAADGNDLLAQWYSDVLLHRKDANNKLRVYRSFKDFREEQDFFLSKKRSILITSRPKLPSVLSGLTKEEAKRTFLIHDEVHRLGSPGNVKVLTGLSDDIRYRLGLSATPEREYDAEGNKFIVDHIGPVIFNFNLEDAIKRNILCPFNYYPLDYQITEDDKRRISELHAIRSARAKEGNPMSDEEFWIAISTVYKNSRAKIPIFRGFIDGRKELLKRSIVFVETQEYGSEVLDVIHNYRADFHTYFSGEDSKTLLRFALNELECLITCHRLSEGIDIKSLGSVILFSSSRARLETIQRIGRCLRFDPENPDKIANVVDFIRENSDPDGLNADQERSIWLSDLSTIRKTE
ncbi:DEAD/DEAH box helicase family protein [Desulfofustis glycolicus]|uniref:Superfamily II DNA or RNA helicase n=1 Tax=Desulfofustis glycolicus DSM 9705 TaxID=1121409 RepID=A0A1M5UK67_9BACT|nr:DEAD/DEAH box helicase family protein [Desulfofustis glycolicus]SHH63331.1 Superfamily II DNA or RNA helicase [Desulfofustis glycolicus DSM 9705]